MKPGLTCNSSEWHRVVDTMGTRYIGSDIEHLYCEDLP